MSTRGTLEIDGERYYIGSDAYPSFAKKHLRKALSMNPESAKHFIEEANEVAGFKWIHGKAPKSFTYPFEEYVWKVNLSKKTIKRNLEEEREGARTWKKKQVAYA